MNGSDRVRVAIAGLGGHGRTIQEATEAAGNLDIRAVFDPNSEEAGRSAERYSCECVGSFDELLTRDDLEAIVLVTPNDVHRAQAEAALRAGLDVFVEKPIANRLDDGLAMVEAAAGADRILFVGHNMRRGSAARLTKEIVDAGRLGRPVSAEIHFSSDTGLNLPDGAWRLMPSRCPLLPVMQLGIHAIDLIHYYLDPIVSVAAQARAVAASGGAVDNVVGTFETSRGLLGTIVSNYCTEVRFEYCLSGTNGTLFGTPHTLTFHERTGVTSFETVETYDFQDRPLESYTRQMQAFGSCVRSRETPETDGWAGLRALAVVEAMDAAAQSGKVERVEIPVTMQ